MLALAASHPAVAHPPRGRTQHGLSCANSRPRDCVELVIRQQRIREPEAHWLRVIPGCESSWEPWQVAGPNEGLYQFNVATWRSTPFAGHDPLDAYWSARAAAWGYRHLEHGKYEWACTGILGL